MRSIAVAEAQIEWKQRLARTEVLRPEHTAQKPEHTVGQKPERTGAQKPVHIGAQKFGHTGAGAGAEVEIVVAGFHCLAHLPSAKCSSGRKKRSMS